MFGVYIHIPYCKKKCNYCDFYSLGSSEHVPENYVSAIIRDINAAQGCTPLRPDTVYFGGGTPCLLSPEQVRLILSALCPKPNAEITLEANPGMVSAKKLEGFLKSGVNRLSIGAQTASDDSLKTLGRCHTSQQTRQVFELAKSVGFTNISGDIMLALPNYTLDEMKNTIDMLKNGGCTHISSYMLKIEKDTPFYKNVPKNLPDDDESADFYLSCVEQLEKCGFEQYEISNFAKKGYESRHNLIYWTCKDYIGFGTSAHSSIAKKRYSNAADIKTFIEKSTPQNFEGNVTHEDYIMLRLRLTSGLNLAKLKRDINIEFGKEKIAFFEKLQRENLASFDGKTLKLLPKGMLVQQSILCEIL